MPLQDKVDKVDGEAKTANERLPLIIDLPPVRTEIEKLVVVDVGVVEKTYW